MRLNKLLEGLEYEIKDMTGKTLSISDADREVSGVVNDSRKVTAGSLFLCIKGTNFDGHDAAEGAVKDGACVIVAERDPVFSAEAGADCVIVKTPDTRKAMAYIAAAWFDHPADKLTTIGITGTKGKTTTSYMIRSMLQNAGKKCGLIGTVEVIIGDEHIHAGNTTPESLLLQEYMARMVEKGLDSVVMEVSSQGLMLHRTDAINFDIGIFTNIEADHIGPGEHKDFGDYLRCKSLLFRQCKRGILNADDAHVDDILEGHTCKVTTFGIGQGADLRAVNLAYMHKPGELGVIFDTEGEVKVHAQVPTPGRFSVYNALCAIAVAGELGVDADGIVNALRNISVKGRIEMVPVSDEFTVMIDYAHNAMALKSLLTTLRDYHPARLICLFGCGGNRARDRRFEMGEVSGKLADLTIITSDNPRFEEPLDLIADIVTGIKRTDGEYVTVPDRREAIRYALSIAERGDILVLAGKGHEDYQEIKGEKFPMDERVILKEILEKEPELAKGAEPPEAEVI